VLGVDRVQDVLDGDLPLASSRSEPDAQVGTTKPPRKMLPTPGVIASSPLKVLADVAAQVLELGVRAGAARRASHMMGWSSG